MKIMERKSRLRDQEERRMGRIRNLTENLVTLRESLGLTQTELAELVGVTRSQIVNYETGRRVMSWMAFLAFVQVLGRDDKTRLAMDRLSIWSQDKEYRLIGDEDLEAVRGGVTYIGGEGLSDEALLRLIETELQRRHVPTQ